MKNQPTQSLIIPDDLIFEHILPRFPVKSLIGFKSVCKTWYNLISTIEFAKSQLQFSSSSPNFMISTFCSGRDGELYLLSYDEHNGNLKELVQLDTQFTNTMGKANLVGCCNGLVCLFFDDDAYCIEYFTVWNPATHKHRRIRPPSRERLCKCGFGYTIALDDYKIVAAFFSYGGDESSTQIWVFSLQIGKWKQIDFPEDDGFFTAGGILNGYFAGNSLYWAAYKSGGPFEKRIVCFDLVYEQLREIPIHVTVSSSSSYLDFNCFVIKGCLSLHFRRGDDNSYDVWVMKQQDD
ncbi:hypothetical protein SOVF_121230 [Spinacia oleracea]|nr:hypothetical protein SOVF_121230 [Spinacia oleracea]